MKNLKKIVLLASMLTIPFQVNAAFFGSEVENSQLIRVKKVNIQGVGNSTLYYNNETNNCYLWFNNDWRGSFSMVDCADFNFFNKADHENKLRNQRIDKLLDMIDSGKIEIVVK